MRSIYIDDERLRLILELLTYENYLVCCVALQSGLRISDCLAITRKQIFQKSFTVVEQKTKKKKRIRLSAELLNALRSICGDIYVFEHRTDKSRHRTRQAVYNDIRRACKALRIKGVVSPHSLRKHYAVELMRNGVSLPEIQKALNHDSDLVTMLYCLADSLELQATICNRAKK